MSFLEGLGSGITNLVSLPLQNYYNKKAASKQNSYNWSMWQANNDYNSPINSVARLREAGLNPNLYYGGSGGSIAGKSSSVPITGPAAPNAILAVAEAVKASLQNRQVESAELKLGQDILESQSRTLKNMLDVKHRTGTYDLKKSFLEKQLGLLTQNIAHLQLGQRQKLHDLEYAEKYGLPVGKLHNTLSSFMNLGSRFGEGAASDVFDFQVNSADGYLPYSEYDYIGTQYL